MDANELASAVLGRYSHALRLTRNAHDAQDLLQNTYLKLRTAEIPSDVRNTNAFVAETMRRVWIDNWRTQCRQRNGKVDQTGAPLDTLPSPWGGYFARVEEPPAAPFLAEFDAVLEKLPKTVRDFAQRALEADCDDACIAAQLESSAAEKSRRQLLKKVQRNWQRLNEELEKLIWNDRCEVTRLLEWLQGGRWNGCGEPLAYANAIDSSLRQFPVIEMKVYSPFLTTWLLSKALREKSHRARIQSPDLVEGANQLSARNFRAREERRKAGVPCFFTVLVPECHLGDLIHGTGPYQDCSRDDRKEFGDSIELESRSHHVKVLRIPNTAMIRFARRTRHLETVGLYRVGEDRKTHMIADRDAAFGVRWFTPWKRRHWEESLIAAMEKYSEEVDLVRMLQS